MPCRCEIDCYRYQLSVVTRKCRIAMAALERLTDLPSLLQNDANCGVSEKTWMAGSSPAMTEEGHTLSTKLSTTRFSPALSKRMVSLLPSTAVTLPLPNFW